MNFEDEEENFDKEFDEDLDEDLDEKIDEELNKSTPEVVATKTPRSTITSEGKKISVYLMSTIGPGEKKQKLLIYTGYQIRDIKETVANIFGLDPADFHLSTGGVTMEEGLTLNYYNVNDGDDILLIPASTAG
jgi:hypothetical protein